jgi:hypothetical protein
MKSLVMVALLLGLIGANVPMEASEGPLPQWRVGIGRDIDTSRTTLGAVLPLASFGENAPALALPAGCLEANGIARPTDVDTRDAPSFRWALNKVARESGVFILHCKGEKATRFAPILEASTGGKSWKVWDSATDNERSSVMWEVWGTQLKDDRTYRLDPGNKKCAPRLYDKEIGKLSVDLSVSRCELILVLNFDMPQGRPAARALARSKGLTAEELSSGHWTIAAVTTVGPAHAGALFKSMSEARMLILELRLAGLNAEARLLAEKLSGTPIR